MADERPPEITKPGREPLSLPKRKRIEKVFEVATKKAATASTPHDYDYVIELVNQCVLADPGNGYHVRAYLDNLHKKFGSVSKVGALAKVKAMSARGPVKKALAQEQWDEVIVQGLKVLPINPWDTATLIAMAKAANKSGDRDCEMCYLEAALKGAPKDVECNRLYAVALSDRGLIDQSITFWHRVEQVRPDDEEAKRAIASLTVQKARTSGKFEDESDEARSARQKTQQQEVLTLEQRLLRKIKNEPDDIENYMELAQFFVNKERFGDAEGLLAKAFELSDGDNDIREKWEDCQLRQMRQKIAQAKDPETKKKLQAKYFAKDVEVYKSRVERYPGNLGFKYELGYRYMKTKQYAEAIRELQTAKNDPRRRGMCMLVLGKCFQQINQLRLAVSHYEQAIEEIADHDAENKKQAYYLAGRLSLHLQDLDHAEKHLAALAGLDFNYKDVSRLLDKIAKLRENPPEPPKKEEPPKDQQEGDAGGEQWAH
jgi:tetratricopeptide (TPR) repeat protein